MKKTFILANALLLLIAAESTSLAQARGKTFTCDVIAAELDSNESPTYHTATKKFVFYGNANSGWTGYAVWPPKSLSDVGIKLYDGTFLGIYLWSNDGEKIKNVILNHLESEDEKARILYFGSFMLGDKDVGGPVEPEQKGVSKFKFSFMDSRRSSSRVPDAAYNQISLECERK
jgi:hypothetical protein